MYKIAVSIPEAVAISGLSRTVLYGLFNAGAITPRKSGARTLILVDDLKAYMRSLPSANFAEAA